MGQTKKQRKKYVTPSHPWQAERLAEEAKYTEGYGFKNKKEIWKVIAKLREYKTQVKKIIANKESPQMQKEKEQLFNVLLKYGLIKKDSETDDILDLNPKDLMERRLQTIVYKNGLARSLIHSRQLITHGHVKLEGQKMTVPSYLVPLSQENKISLNPKIIIFKEAKQKVSEEPKIKEITKEEPKIKEITKEETKPVAVLENETNK